MVQTDSLLLHLSLSRITFLSFEEKKELFKNIDSAASLALLSKEDISSIIKRDLSSRVNWHPQDNLKSAEKCLTYCNMFNIQILLNTDQKYPEILRNISDPPYLLFCRGNVDILSEKSVSVVGTRKLSSVGKEAAVKFSYDAVIDGINVISGLANGADAYAHKGAVEAYFDFVEHNKDLSKLGKTIAVLPSSIDQIVPSSNKKLASQILQSGGLIISEYEPKLQLANFHFVGRNRIIAGLSPATVVIEAPAGSGALITADFALEEGRDVFFHKATFNNLASQISNVVKSDLQVRFAQGEVTKYKIENTPEKFLEAGAPVIEDYKDYCESMKLAPGLHNRHKLQSELF